MNEYGPQIQAAVEGLVSAGAHARPDLAQHFDPAVWSSADEDTGVPTGYYLRGTPDGDELVMTQQESLARELCANDDWEHVSPIEAWNTCINSRGRDHYRKLARIAIAHLSGRFQ